MFFHKMQKKSDFGDKKEPIILFMLFFLPGFLSQSKVVDGSIFNSAWFNMIYIITVLPQILLILYLIEKKTPGKTAFYGISRIQIIDLLYGLLYFAGIMIIVFSTGIISVVIEYIGFNSTPELPMWKFDNIALIPLVFLTCMATGYSEELFFRSYLLTEFNSIENRVYLIGGTSFLFALGHIYQGLGGFLGTFAIGIFLASIFMKNRRLHSIAIAHGIYNFTVLIISVNILD
jgi:uncharacterized protein